MPSPLSPLASALDGSVVTVPLPPISGWLVNEAASFLRKAMWEGCSHAKLKKTIDKSHTIRVRQACHWFVGGNGDQAARVIRWRACSSLFFHL